MVARKSDLPLWAHYALLPLLNLSAALIVSGLVIWGLGENPFKALAYLIDGAFGFAEARGYTLYYATNFIFTGLAISVAFKAGLFNIGAEGQAAMGGLGLSLAVLYLGSAPQVIVIAVAIGAAMLFGGLWAAIPAYLQAKRGSHIVITTIMFNFIAAAIVSYLLVGPLQRQGAQFPESEDFALTGWMPRLDGWPLIGDWFAGSPLNLSFIIALMAALAVWFFFDRTKKGYEIKVIGQNPRAATFAGISISKGIILAMVISGGLAGLLGLNELMGVQHRMVANFTMGYGFVGIAVAFMGRNHAFGIVIAAILFGAIYQGGSELAFEMPMITRDLIVMVQGLVILFTGAAENLFERPARAIVTMVTPKAGAPS